MNPLSLQNRFSKQHLRAISHHNSPARSKDDKSQQPTQNRPLSLQTQKAAPASHVTSDPARSNVLLKHATLISVHDPREQKTRARSANKSSTHFRSKKAIDVQQDDQETHQEPQAFHFFPISADSLRFRTNSTHPPSSVCRIHHQTSTAPPQTKRQKTHATAQRDKRPPPRPPDKRDNHQMDPRRPAAPQGRWHELREDEHQIDPTEEPDLFPWSQSENVGPRRTNQTLGHCRLSRRRRRRRHQR